MGTITLVGVIYVSIKVNYQTALQVSTIHAAVRKHNPP